MTSQAEIREWLKTAPEGATHMVVVVDKFDYDDYPVYYPDELFSDLLGEKTLANVIDYYQTRPMSGVMEVYALHLDHEAPLAERRAWHTESQS